MMRIAIVGGQESVIAKAAIEAAQKGARIRTYEHFDDAVAAVGAGLGADLLLMDAKSDIRTALLQLADARIHLPVLAYGMNCGARDAANAIRAGAQDFLPLPPDQDLISALLSEFVQTKKGLVDRDPRMREVLDLAVQIAPTDATVLITGESGTGKEVMARLIHERSKRAGYEFVSVNCAAIPENLLESELFGHEKGAFTGATKRRVGKFEEADGGTLLLDEISEMDVRLQAKLLRAIQEREIDRVGGTKPVPVNIRLLATSNRDLELAVKEGVFREDLLFRLNVLNLEIPPLRERPLDIEAIANEFLIRFSQSNGLANRHLSGVAKKALLAYNWPGNVRELENCIHRAVLLARGQEVQTEHLRLPEIRPANNAQEGGHAIVGRTVAEVERELILQTLDSTAGNRTRAAEILGISIRTLRNKLHQYGANEYHP